MKFLFVLCLFFSVSVWGAFINGSDIPLMDGLVIDENDSFSFDTPEGQIMTVTAKTTASTKAVSSFYEESLKALGWQKKSTNQYRRDQDELTLQVVPGKTSTTLKLQLTFTNK